MAFDYVGKTDLLYILNKIKAVLDAGYVQTEDGKVLSTNDFTNALKSKLDGIAEGAEVNVQADWNQTNSTADDYIKNKPNIPEGVVVDTQMSDSSTNAVQNKIIKAYVDSAVGAVVGVKFEKVTQLPTTGQNGVIYLLPKTTTSSQNVYEEYIWISQDSAFEKIGETTIDLSNYVQTTDLVEITTTDIDNMFNTVFGE